MMSPAQQCGSGPGGFPFFSPHISNPYHDQYTHPLFRSNLNQGYHGHSPSPPSDISSSPDNIRGGYSSRPWTTGYSSYPPHQDTRLNSAPENTRPEHYNNGIPRIQAHSNPPRSFHIPETVTSGMGGGMISGLSGGGGGGMGDGSGMGVGWHQQQISNMQDSFMHLSNHGHYANPGGQPGDINVKILEQLNMTTAELIMMPTRHLNKTLKVAKGLTREQIKLMKTTRRTMKNRGYAASCRVKRETQITELKKELTEVDVTTEEVQKEVDNLARECSVLATSLDSLQKLTRPQ